jgi:hypothetical protein
MSDHECCRVRMLIGLTVVIDQEFCPTNLHPVIRRDIEARLLLHAAAASMAGETWQVLWTDLRDESTRPVSQSGNPYGRPVERGAVILAAGAALRVMAVDRPWLARLLAFGDIGQEAAR